MDATWSCTLCADRLVNYVAKGGKYKTKTDLLKTYGFTQSDLERLNDYILLDSVITTIEINR
jgi:hypothetical protein